MKVLFNLSRSLKGTVVTESAVIPRYYDLAWRALPHFQKFLWGMTAVTAAVHTKYR
jgi:hypothetical protein